MTHLGLLHKSRTYFLTPIEQIIQPRRWSRYGRGGRYSTYSYPSLTTGHHGRTVCYTSVGKSYLIPYSSSLGCTRGKTRWPKVSLLALFASLDHKRKRLMIFSLISASGYWKTKDFLWTLLLSTTQQWSYHSSGLLQAVPDKAAWSEGTGTPEISH